jgi:hypothetical protein
MKCSYAFKTLLASALYFCIQQTAFAGEWAFFPQSARGSDECSAEFTGTIMKGDLTGAYLNGRLSSFNRICLDSPGGNLMEVYEFIQLFENVAPDSDDPYIFSTRVRSGDKCLYACAILFMFGQNYGANSPYPDRVLDPNAQLGFHSPFIDPVAARQVDSSSAFAGAVSIANLLASRTYKQVTTRGAALAPELLSIILGTPPDDMYIVRHLAELSILDISTSPLGEQRVVLRFERPVIETTLKRICASSHVLSNRNWFVTDGYDFADLIRFSREIASDENIETLQLVHRTETRIGYAPDTVVAVLTGPYFVPGWFSAGASLYCMVEMNGQVDQNVMKVSNYNVNFGYMNRYSGGIPEAEDGFNGPSFGLVPIDTIYE